MAASDPVTAVGNALTSGFDFFGDLIYSEGERVAHELGFDTNRTRRREADAAETVARENTRATMYAGAFDQGEARTWVVGGVVVAAIAAGAFVMVKGDT